MAPPTFSQHLSLAPGWDLNGFNRLVLAHQDQVFTLAFHLLGNETAACEAVECAFRGAYSQRSEPLGFRLQALRQALRSCLNNRRELCGSPWLRMQAGNLSNREKIAIILVECLQLSYTEAAVVMDEPREQIRTLLAGARHNVMLTTAQRPVRQAQSGDHER